MGGEITRHAGSSHIATSRGDGSCPQICFLPLQKEISFPPIIVPVYMPNVESEELVNEGVKALTEDEEKAWKSAAGAPFNYQVKALPDTAGGTSI